MRWREVRRSVAPVGRMANADNNLATLGLTAHRSNAPPYFASAHACGQLIFLRHLCQEKDGQFRSQSRKLVGLWWSQLYQKASEKYTNSPVKVIDNLPMILVAPR